jgi:LysM repeat protein
MRKAVAGGLLMLLAAPLLMSCFLGGGGGQKPSALRPSSIPTATPPASLPEPILVGETQAINSGPNASVSGEQTYVVKSGDTLSSIAAALGVPASQQASWVQQVLQLNGIPDATQLQAGVSLTLPRLPTPRPSDSPTVAPAARTATPGVSSPAPTTSAASPTPRPTVSGGGGTYTVASGDYPLLIAQKLGVPEGQQSAWANQLVALNGIDPSNLQVGQVLQLPPIPSASTPTP